jgi:NAD(P)-dependent dehydrogenase (short-subunit alcohol dehydrogenase family)
MKNIVITGATSGVGMNAACTLAGRGNRVLVLARSAEKGNALEKYYRKNYAPTGKGSIEIVLCDLNSFESITNACNQIIACTPFIDVLINNAGVWNSNYRESEDGIEETLQVNVLAPLLLNHLLLNHLLKSNDARSIFAASALHQGTIEFFDLEFKDNFSGFKAYRQSKLSIILLCRLLAKKFSDTNIGFYCEHPGFINTGITRDTNWFTKFLFHMLGDSPEKGARTLVHLAVRCKSQLVSGEYYVNKQIRETSPQSYDLEVAETLLEAYCEYLTNYIGTSSPILDSKKNIFHTTYLNI